MRESGLMLPDDILFWGFLLSCYGFRLLDPWHFFWRWVFPSLQDTLNKVMGEILACGLVNFFGNPVLCSFWEHHAEPWCACKGNQFFSKTFSNQ